MDAYRNSVKTAIAHLRKGQAVQALAQVEAATQAAPHRALGHRVRGLALVQLGRRRKAAAAFEQSLALDAAQPQLAEDLGRLWMQLGQARRAEAYLRSALAAGRRSVLPTLVHCLLAQGRLVDAETLTRAIPLRRPAWVVGCGRSGTTALGRALEAHPGLTYLNEPHHLWGFDPDNLIWGDATGQLVRSGAPPERLDHVRRAFAAALSVGPGPQLVEKLPVNAFRIPYLLALAPDSRFIWILRDPVEVAASIERCTAKGTWYVGRKKGFLLALAAEQGIDARLLERAQQDAFVMGLIEWRLANAFVLAHAPAERTLCVRYDQLLAEPDAVADALAAHLGLGSSGPIARFARQRLRRIHEPPTRTLTAAEAALVAPILAAV